MKNEIETLIRLANILAVRQTQGDVEEVRSIMLLRLEEYVRRSKEALDLRSEMMGLKQIAIVMGLATEQKDDFFVGISNVIRSIAAERQNNRRELLPPGRQIACTVAQESTDSFSE